MVNASKMQELYDRKERKHSLSTKNKYLKLIARGVIQHNRRDFLETFWNKLDVIEEISNEAGKEGRIDILEEIQNKTDKGMMKKVKENTWPCYYASQAGRVDVMEWLKSNGWSFSAKSCMFSAGNLEVLKWTLNNGCLMDEDTIWCAVINGRLDFVKWLRSQGCPWNKDACAVATQNGHLDVLIWLRSNGCPWNVYECLDSINNAIELEEDVSNNLLPWIQHRRLEMSQEELTRQWDENEQIRMSARNFI